MSSLTRDQMGVVLLDHPKDLPFDHSCVQAIAKNMRFSDKVEVHLSHRLKPAEALLDSIDSSTHLALIVDPRMPENKPGEPWVPLAIGGIGPLKADDTRLIWMLGHELLDRETRYPRQRREFARCTLAVVQHFAEQGGTLHNWCHAKNEKTLRWLPWLGFTVAEPELVGDSEAPFCHFWMEP